MEDKIWNCIIKRLTETESEESEQYLDRWLEEDANNIQQYNEICLLWSLSGRVGHVQPEVQVQDLFSHHPEPLMKKTVAIKHFWKYGIAASLICLLFVAIYQYRSGAFRQNSVQEWVVKRAEAGKMVMVQLPDSSKIWLNAGSEIRFLKHFNEAETRSVILNGEAYFDVSHDARHPFVVKSGELSTTVYGTSFNIRAYGNEAATSVTVNSGKVGVKAVNDTSKMFMLLPNDKLVYAGRKFTKLIADTEADGWVRGDLLFDQTPLAEVFTTISRKFNVRIEADVARYQDCRLTARFANQPLSAVLKTLKLAMNIQSTQTGQTIYIKGGAACSNSTK